MIREFILVSIEVKVTASVLNFYVALIELQSLVGTLDIVSCLSFFPMDSPPTGVALNKALKVSVFSSDVD
jgi:hypothetical protein